MSHAKYVSCGGRSSQCAERADIRLLFADVRMPGMNGVELAEKARRLRPDVKIVLTSGYSDALAMRPDENLPLLHKPYSLDALSSALSEALKR